MSEFPRPSLVVLVGASSAGKSTWAAARFRPNEIVSLSRLTAALGEHERDLRANLVAYELLERIVDVRLGRGLTVVIDTPGLDDDRRLRWQRAAEAHSIPQFAVLFFTDVETCLARNEARAHPLATNIIDRQTARCREITPAIAAQGFEVRTASMRGGPEVEGGSGIVEPTSRG